MLKAVLSKKELTQCTDYYECVKDLLNDCHIRQLDNIIHHCCTSRFQHSLNVSYYNFRLCRFLRLDAKSAARAGLFHDLFFFDHRECDEYSQPHKAGQIFGKRLMSLFRHPSEALCNACELYSVNPTEADMIVNHMWPLTFRMPRRRETLVITLVDKFCAVAEVMTHAAGVCHTKFRLAETFALMLLVKLTLR